MLDISLQRVEVLLQQERYAEAEEILQGLFRNDPTDALVLSLLGEVKLQSGDYAAAHHYADQSMGIEPNNPRLHYLKARVNYQEHKLKEAITYIDEAIQLDPEDADFYAMKAAILLQQKNFQAALDAADEALDLDAENLLALNMRTTALQKLDRKEDAFLTIEGALKEDPNNSYTHSNYGWNLLEAGDHKKAQEHFKLALQNDPNNEYAQQGMVQAIKAGNPLYRIFLKYSFFMTNLTGRYQWGVIIGFYVGVRLLRGLAESNEALRPFLIPLIILLTIVAFSTWIITPVSNLLFRLHPYGKYMLDKQEIKSANLVGLSLAVSAIGFITYLIAGSAGWLVLGFLGFTLTVPLGTMYASSKNKQVLLWYPAGMAIVGALAVMETFRTEELFNGYSTAYLIGLFAYQWIANALVIRENN
ncbi:tetratricopeptide repeat protein [Flavihumibacter sp. UBA7668]|uniref:tetratricopeptide repeat protein n=1 Tax=Flavihumibacter sp. UBA7668 TaxID=1946542 RepID=UPI0025B7C621|nr:tetratricopeptide repeat protein [Flavihumibacter sp. UBA7668]